MSLTTTIVTGLDPHWIELASAVIGSDRDDLAVIVADIDLTDASVHLSVTRPDSSSITCRTEDSACCVTCTLREAVLPHLGEASEGGLAGVVLGLPAGIEACYLMPSLLEAASDQGLDLALGQVIHVVDIDVITEQLAFGSGCDICEALEQQPRDFTREALADADIVMAVGQDAAGSALLDELRETGVRRLDSLGDLSGDLALSTRHVKPAWDTMG